MNMGPQKVAILVDSGTDLPADFVGKGRVFTAPVQYPPKIREPAVPGAASGPFSHKPERESPPALPSASGLFTRLAEEDYEAVLIITSSSRLSSAYDELGVLASREKRLRCRMVDTKSVSVGAGLQAILAARLLEMGEGMGEVLAKLEFTIRSTKTFLCPEKACEASKGGFPGGLSIRLGFLRKPWSVLSCSREGTYEEVAKARGNAQALAKAIALMDIAAGQHPRFAAAASYGSLEAEPMETLLELKEKLPQCEEFFFSRVSLLPGFGKEYGAVCLALQPLPSV